MNISQAGKLIREDLEKIKKHKVELHQGCVACHVIFSLKERQGHTEQDAADLLSDTLIHDPKLNQEFIDVVEQIHMMERNLGGAFALRERESKDATWRHIFLMFWMSLPLICSSYHILLY